MPQVLQERITAEGYIDEAGKHHVFSQVAVMNLVQAAVGFLVGFIGLQFVEVQPDAPVSKFAMVGFTTTIASPIGCTCGYVVDVSALCGMLWLLPFPRRSSSALR